MLPRFKQTLGALFLITLPLTISPIAQGIFGGIHFGFWARHRILRNVEHLTGEIKTFDQHQYWSLPGAQSFQDFYEQRYNFYHVPKLNTADWARKLGLILPRQYSDWNVMEGVNSGVDKLADLDTLMYDPGSDCKDHWYPEQWVYISSILISDTFFSPWNKAFDQIIQENDAFPLNHTSFFYVECASAPFLCGVWGVQNPALLHFKTLQSLASEEESHGLTYDHPVSTLRPVEVRVIELPLTNEYTGLSPHVFPSELEQMRAVIRNPGFHEQIETYSAVQQLMLRFREHMVRVEKSYRIMPAVDAFDEWMVSRVSEPLGVEPILQILLEIVFTLWMALTALTLAIYDFLVEGFKYFLGYPAPLDWALGDDLEPSSMWEDMLGGFWDSFDNRFSDPTGQSTWASGSSVTPSPSTNSRG